MIKIKYSHEISNILILLVIVLICNFNNLTFIKSDLKYKFNLLEVTSKNVLEDMNQVDLKDNKQTNFKKDLGNMYEALESINNLNNLYFIRHQLKLENSLKYFRKFILITLSKKNSFPKYLNLYKKDFKQLVSSYNKLGSLSSKDNIDMKTIKNQLKEIDSKAKEYIKNVPLNSEK